MAHFFIDRPVLAWVIAIVILLAGVLSLPRLPVAQYPDIAPPQVTISTAFAEAARLSQQAARTTVAGSITLAYLDLRHADETIALTRQSLARRREALRLMQAMAEQGQTGRLGVLQAEQAIAEADAALPPLQIARDQAVNRIVRLTAGQGGDLGTGGQPVARGKPSVGLPAEVIRARPDVQIAERGLAAALARVGVAEAAFWPSVSLSGSITPTVQRGGGRQAPWSFGPRIDLPIFAGGTRSAALSGAEARAVQAEARWRASVLTAVEEVANGLSAWQRGRANVAAQRRLVAAGEETVALARATWTAGEGDIFTVLKAEQDLLAARSALATALHDQAAAYVALSIAAGGASE